MKKMLNVAFEALVRKSGVRVRHAVEVGAHSVEFCNLGHYLTDRNVRIQLFEPQPDMAEQLRRETGNLSNVTVWQMAIADHIGTCAMRMMGAGTHIKGIAAPEVVNKNTKSARAWRKRTVEELAVPCDTFSRYDDGEIDMLSLDSEGAEWFVLKYMESRPRWISIEMGDDKHPYKNPFADEILAWMDKHGYARQGEILDRDWIWRRE